MKEIIIKFTEENLLATTGKTSGELSELNGYQSKIANKNYQPQVESPQIQDPDWVMPPDFDMETGVVPMVDNPNYIPAVGEPVIDNPDSKTVHLAKKLTEYAIKEASKKLKDSFIKEAAITAESAFDASINAVIESAEITVIE